MYDIHGELDDGFSLINDKVICPVHSTQIGPRVVRENGKGDAGMKSCTLVNRLELEGKGGEGEGGLSSTKGDTGSGMLMRLAYD